MLKKKNNQVVSERSKKEGFPLSFFPTLPDVSDNSRRVKEMIEELKKYQEGEDYFVSTDSGKQIYTINSKKLKSCLRGIIFSDEYWKKAREGQRFTEGNFFSYKEDIGNITDSFIVMNDWKKSQKIETNEDNSSGVKGEIKDKEEEENWLSLGKNGEKNQKLTDKSSEITNDNNSGSSKEEYKFSAVHEKSTNKKENNYKGSGGEGAYWLIGILSFISLLGTVIAIKTK